MSTVGYTIKEGLPKFAEANYSSNVLKKEQRNSVVAGSFYQVKPITIREMVIRRVNKSLCFCLLVTICIAFVSYYIAMNYEAGLNNLDREIVRINTENQDLQAELDRYKSFNNVDDKVGKLQLLQKAEKVIEVTDKSVNKPLAVSQRLLHQNQNWAIGY